ncbi:MAG: HAMP domain-containing histidine kinase [Firmicutes bacterium]|nr:HAMP domain-containing histidine kinase [Bacillota bacterium]
MNSHDKKSITNDIALIAHEFRTPIDIISKSAELVSRVQKQGDIEKEKLQVIMEGILKNCHRMNLLTEQIISVAQHENKSLKVIVEKGNVEQFINDIQNGLDKFKSQFNIDFIFEVNFEDPYAVSDFKKLETILLNLISNAVKYSKKVDRSVTIRAYDSKDSSRIFFAVKDKGIGISQKELGRIFNKYYRIENFNTRQTEGCGLGLTIVRTFIETLGGEITVESEEGKGSEFVVMIPRFQKATSEPLKFFEASIKYTLHKTSIEESFANIKGPE